MSTPKTLPRSWWANSSWSRGGAQLIDDDLHRLGNVNHYPGRSSDFGRLSLESLRRNIRGWWNYHVNTRGWSDIGYQTAIAMTEDGPVVVDLRGIGRVPAAHASTSNPRANWHGGATLWLIGNTERPDDQLIDAYRWYRHEIWLPRWPTATGVTHHRDVPGAQTSCAGDHMDRLVRSGTLAQPPQEDDMPITRDDARMIAEEVANYGTTSLATDNPSTLLNQIRWGHRRADTAAVRAQPTRRIESKLDALIAANEGLDTEAILARINEVAEQGADERAEILDLVEQVGTGEATAEDVVRLIGEKLTTS